MTSSKLQLIATWVIGFMLLSVSAYALRVMPYPSSTTNRESISRFYGINPSEDLSLLTVKGYQQTEEYTCGPAAVMSLMHYYGLLSPLEMTKSTELRIAKEMGTSKDVGTSQQQMVNWLKQHGFEVISGKKGTLDLLRSHLKKGEPVIIDWFDWGGHWAVAIGYNKDLLFLADPYVQHDTVKSINGIMVFNINRFESMWYDAHLVKGIYIIAVPKTMTPNTIDKIQPSTVNPRPNERVHQ